MRTPGELLGLAREQMDGSYETPSFVVAGARDRSIRRSYGIHIG
jgi:hypothetical protein